MIRFLWEIMVVMIAGLPGFKPVSAKTRWRHFSFSRVSTGFSSSSFGFFGENNMSFFSCFFLTIKLSSLITSNVLVASHVFWIFWLFDIDINLFGQAKASLRLKVSSVWVLGLKLPGTSKHIIVQWPLESIHSGFQPRDIRVTWDTVRIHPTGCPPDVFFIHFDHPACNKLSLLPKAPWKFGKVCRMEVIKKTMETWKNRSQVLHSIWTSLCWCWQRPESCFLAQSLSLISSILHLLRMEHLLLSWL